MYYTVKDNTITITKGMTTIRLTRDEFLDIEKSVNISYYREDVTDKIDKKIEEGNLPEAAAENTAYIDAVTQQYTEYREDYGDGTDENIPWTTCLDMAFDEVDYEDFAA